MRKKHITVRFVSTDYSKKPYCKYCGELIKNGHDEKCPITNPDLPFLKGSGMILGFRPKNDDPLFNLHMCREAILTTLRKHKDKLSFGPKNKETRKRLKYESIKFVLQRFDLKYLRKELEKTKNPIKKYFLKRDIKKAEKIVEKAFELAVHYNLDKNKIKKLYTLYT